MSEELKKELERYNTGAILFIALWSLCLLAIFAVYLGYGVKQKIALIDKINSRASMFFIAEAGVKQAVSEFKNREVKSYDALNEEWSNNPVKFKGVKIGYGEVSVCYNHMNYHSREKEVRYGLIDEERKINLNMEDIDVIQRLLIIVAGLEETDALNLAASIIDWRDKDDALSIHSNSAEDEYYRNLPNPYESKDAEFQVIDELLLVKGMTQEILNKLRNYITIYSNGRININTVSGEVLLTLNLGSSLVNKIISFRAGKDGIEGTEDDNVFFSLSTITVMLNNYVELSSAEFSKLNTLIATGRISTSSSNFMIRAVARLDKRESEIVCVLDADSEMLYWRES